MCITWFTNKNEKYSAVHYLSKTSFPGFLSLQKLLDPTIDSHLTCNLSSGILYHSSLPNMLLLSYGTCQTGREWVNMHHISALVSMLIPMQNLKIKTFNIFEILNNRWCSHFTDEYNNQRKDNWVHLNEGQRGFGERSFWC